MWAGTEETSRMALMEYVLFAIVLTALTAVVKSHRILASLSLIHVLACFSLIASVLSGPAFPRYYIEENFMIDHLAVYEILIAASVFLLVVIYRKDYLENLLATGFLSKGNLPLVYAAMNALLLFIVLSFSSNNLALLWIFTELTTLFAALMIAVMNSQKNIDAALKYVFISSTVMVFTFIGLVLLFTSTEKVLGTGTLNWSVLMENADKLEPDVLTAAFAFIFLGFAAKAGIAPFHTALPHAYSKAPSSVSTVLSAVVLNIGLFGILRIYSIMRVTSSATTASNILLAYGILSIFIGAFSMLQQRNIRKLIAFSSVENSGLMLIGIGISTPTALFWVLLHTLAYSLTKASLFLSTGILHNQYMSNKIENIKDALSVQPFASGALIIGTMAIIGIPPFLPFATKFSILAQIAKYSIALLIPVLGLILITYAGFAAVLTEAFTKGRGEEMTEALKRYHAPAGLKIPIVILLLIVLFLGLCTPKELIELINNITKTLYR
jgi:hydrogenase-4 component F